MVSPMQTPTIVFTTTDYGMNLQTALYGEVSPARLEKEKAIAKWRCEQLAPQPRKQERPRRRRPSNDRYMSSIESAFEDFDRD